MSSSLEDLQLLSSLLDSLLELPLPERQAWLEALTGPAARLRPRLQQALADALARPESLLQLPALDGPRPGEPVPGSCCGAFELLESIGVGGMGQVWRARRNDGLYEREVAIKLPRLTDSGNLMQRMARERLIGARLEHSRIARLYEAGIDEVLGPYIVMELVQGRHLLEHARAASLDRVQRIRLMLQVCEAVAHAHRHLVVHRDIKPSNVLVDGEGEVKLLDFGVARLLDADGAASSGSSSESGLTRTPRYAAPEQALGGPITTATDVHALGAVLRELLEDTPGPLPPELRGVLDRAMAIDPAGRHASAEALADDLRAVLAHRRPAAVDLSMRRRLRLWILRHRLWTSLGLGLVSLLILAASLLAIERGRTEVQARRLAQVREFMLTTFTDAEAPAGQAMASVTAVQLIEQALDRARRSFADDLVLRAEVLNEIAIMWRRFDRPKEAAALFREAHQLMQAHAGEKDPGRQIVAAQWALELVAQAARGEDSEQAMARAGPLAAQALARCGAGLAVDRRRCALARGTAHAALRNMAALQGDDAASLRQAQAVVRAFDDAFGVPSAEAAVARLELAAALRNAGRSQDARPVLAEAEAMALKTPLHAGDDIRRRLTQAMLEGDLGRDAAALETLAGLRPLLAEDAPDLALLLRLRGEAALNLGRFTLALDAARQALDVARRREDGWEQANALAVSVHVLGAEGRLAEAEAAWQGWRQVVEPEAETGLQSVRMRRAKAELDMRAGRTAQALESARALTRGPFLTAQVTPIEQLKNWLLCANALRQQGSWDDALAALGQAARLGEALLPAGHPLRLRVAFEAVLVRALRAGTGAGAMADDSLRSSAARLMDGWPADSGWRAHLQPVLDDPKAGQMLVL